MYNDIKDKIIKLTKKNRKAEKKLQLKELNIDPNLGIKSEKDNQRRSDEMNS